MISNPFDVPILIIGFNRPQFLNELIMLLKDVAPSRVYVAIDGPRDLVVSDKEKVLACQQVLKNIDWDCEVFEKFESSNLGCRESVIQAIDWVFEKEERVIILEDDIRPKKSFFDYSSELLEAYQNNHQVLAISGFNSFYGFDHEHSYRFSSIIHVWGWATWRRTWELYPKNLDLSTYKLNSKKIKYHFDCSWFEANVLNFILKKVFSGKIDTWDYQLLYLSIMTNTLSVTPNSNMIENVGFDIDSSHTKVKPSFLLPASDIEFPLQHPDIKRDFQADRWVLGNSYGINFRYVLKRIFHFIIREIMPSRL